MRWLVGIDLNAHCDGAVTFAKWLAGRGEQERLYAVHVVESAIASYLVPMDEAARESVIETARRRALAPFGDDRTFADVGSVVATAAEDGLNEAAEHNDCGAVIVGRRKPADERALVRLGRVARRMLRDLDRPVVVVPPHLSADALSDGPVVVATDLGDASLGAARFGSGLAARLDLDLLLTHVAIVPSELNLLVPAEQWSNVVSRAAETGHTGLNDWAAAHGLLEARRSVVHGSVVPQLLDVAQVSGASMLVVGSRGLKGLDRLFMSSIASALAAVAALPVVVVPQGWSP